MFSSLLFSFNNFYIRIVATVQVFAVGWYDIVYMGAIFKFDWFTLMILRSKNLLLINDSHLCETIFSNTLKRS